MVLEALGWLEESEVEEDEGTKVLEGRNADGVVTPVEASPLVSILPWQMAGTSTGVASTAEISVVVSMVRERPGKAE